MKKHKPSAKEVAAEAYQVVGSLAVSQELFEHPETQRALDYFHSVASGNKVKRLTPFGKGLPRPELS